MRELPSALARLSADDAGLVLPGPVFVDLDSGGPVDVTLAAEFALRDHIVVGVSAYRVRAQLRPLARRLTCTLTAGPARDRAEIGVPDVDAAAMQIASSVARNPVAAATLTRLLQITQREPVEEGLVVESLAYSTLLASSEFASWRAGRAVRRKEYEPAGDAVQLTRSDDRLVITLNRPHRRNAFNTAMRDGLIEALGVVLLDDSLSEVDVVGAGADFCSGGDLDEFGSVSDVAVAHVVRLDRSVAALVHRCRDRVRMRLHGACIGAGIEIPSFASRISARPSAFIQLPEIGMGLIPGAGGTVGLTRRIGRWRTAFLALTGRRIDVHTALDWGLIDAVE